MAVLSLQLGHRPNPVLVPGAFFHLEVKREGDRPSEVELAVQAVAAVLTGELAAATEAAVELEATAGIGILKPAVLVEPPVVTAAARPTPEFLIM